MFKLKQSRLLCLLFALILCFQGFSLSVSAASDNLIDSNLSNWKDLSYTTEDVYPITVTPAANVYRLTLNQQELPMYFGVVLDETSLIAGHSYSLSFRLPSRTECNNAFGNSYSASVYQNHFKNSQIRIGIGYISSSGEFTTSEDNILYNITKDNYTNFFGKTLKASFIASNYTGTPAVFIQLFTLDGANHTFYFSDFKLVDNDDNSAELTGIKGFLHSIRWDLVGGICEEEDCPHSAAGNPHKSLSERMSSGFASQFQAIGSKFEEGSTLNTWFTGLSDKVGSINGSLTGLGDRINGFFSGLGDRISGFFSSLGDRMSGFFINLGTSIGGFFSDLKTNMSNWFSELGNKITTKFQEIGDKFTEFFEKFKPRVYINFDWQAGYANPSTGVITTKPYEDGYFYDKGKGYCLITDFFEVPEGSEYFMDFVRYDSSSYVRIFKYDLSGNFISSEVPIYNNFDNYLLESKYKYIFMISFGSDYPSDEDMNDRCNDSVLVYADEGWINALLYNLKMGIKGLFVPDESAILDLKSDLDTVLQDHLGIIYTSSNLVTDLINTAFDIVFDAPDTYSLSVPEVTFEVAGTEIHLWDNTGIDFSFMEMPIFKTLYGMYTVALYFLFGVLEIKYAMRVYRRMMAN